MDLDEFRAILSNSTADVWEFIDAAITVASMDFSGELKRRRDGIVERMYSERCRNCDGSLVDRHRNGVGRCTTTEVNDDVRGGDNDNDNDNDNSPLTPQSVPLEDEDDEPDPYGGLFDDEQTKILRIKEQLEYPNQTDDVIAELLQTLADMDLTFTALKETDIGRNVNRLRKHPSNEVRTLVKQLVRKWKDLVDQWVGSNNSLSTLTDSDSPLVQNVARGAQNGYQQGPDFGYSPNPHNGSSGSERNNSEPEQNRPKPVISKKPTSSRPPAQSRPAMVASASAVPPPNRTQRDENIDLDRLASARKRLHENYQEAQNAKKQRTIQMMDIHEIPKPRNGYIAKNKGNFHGRQNR